MKEALEINIFAAILAVLASVIGFIAIGVVFFPFLNHAPDLTWLAKDLVLERGMLAPEPGERALYLISLCYFPLAIYYLLSKIRTGLSPYQIKSCALAALYPLLLFLIYHFAADEDLWGGYWIFKERSAIALYIWPILGLAPLLAIVFNNENLKKRFTSLWEPAWDVVAIAGIVPTVLTGLIGPRSDYLFSRHFNGVFYSVFQVALGKNLTVDFLNTYGLYPYFVNWILRGSQSVAAFTGFMALLTGLSYLFLYLSARPWIKNRAWLAFGMWALVYFNFFVVKIRYFLHDGTFDPYFNYFPIRTITPCLSLWLGSLFIKSGKNRYKWLGLFFCSLGTLWNPESGWISWLAFCTLIIWSDALVGKIVELGKAAALLLVVTSGVLLAIRFQTGVWIRLAELYTLPRIFYELGYYMMPMPLLHPWLWFALIYLAAIGYVALHLLEARSGPQIKWLTQLTLIGLGLFSYYQGRSNDFNFVAPLYPAMIVSLFLVDQALQQSHRPMIAKFLIGLVMLVIMPLTITYISETRILGPVMSQRLNEKALSEVMRDELAILKEEFPPGIPALFVSRGSAWFHFETKTPFSYFDGFFELYRQKDLQELREAITAKKIPKFAMDTFFFPKQAAGMGLDTDLGTLIEQNYKILKWSKHENFVIMIPRPSAP